MQEHVTRASGSRAIAFDAAKLDRLMEAAELDVVFATSKHNVQYLLGAERAIFFDYMDAVGVSRYLPVLVYPRGAPEKSVYIGHRLETYQRAVAPPWVPQVRTESNGSVDAIMRAVSAVKDAGVPMKRIGVEMAFLPMDAGRALADALPGAELKDALLVLERLRAVKSADELAKLRTASELVIASMLEVISQHGPGTTKQQCRTPCASPRSIAASLSNIACWPAAAATTGRRRSSAGSKARCCRWTPAAIITAISATSPAWPYWASRMPS